jgi:hypothetical protein
MTTKTVRINTFRTTTRGLTAGVVNWNDLVNMDCLNLIDYGLHADTIAKATGLSKSQVYYRAKLAGQRLRDYRNGRGPVGRVLFTKFKVSSMNENVQNIVASYVQERTAKLEMIQQAKRKNKAKKKKKV